MKNLSNEFNIDDLGDVLRDAGFQVKGATPAMMRQAWGLYRNAQTIARDIVEQDILNRKIARTTGLGYVSDESITNGSTSPSVGIMGTYLQFLGFGGMKYPYSETDRQQLEQTLELYRVAQSKLPNRGYVVSDKTKEEIAQATGLEFNADPYGIKARAARKAARMR